MDNIYSVPSYSSVDFGVQNTNSLPYYSNNQASPDFYTQQQPSPSFVGPQRTHPSLPSSRRRPAENFVPMDAPTQPRRYVGPPSVTTRREIPAYFINRQPSTRSHSASEEEDELPDEPLAPNATEQEKIEHKRRQNTLAARRSRKRRADYVSRLEETVEALSREKEMWKTRALTLRQLLRGHQLPCPDFHD